MKGIILAGGVGQRLQPLTFVTNKHLLPVYDRPMIFYAVDQFARSGVEHVMLVTGREHMSDFQRLLGTGSGFDGCRLEYACQERPGGIADALALAERFADGGPVAVLLADNLFEHSIASLVEEFRANPHGARVVLAEVEDARSFGVALFRDSRIAKIVEKPERPPSRFAVTGLYFYDARVFDFIRELRPSHRGELEITDVNNRYLERGELTHSFVRGYWIDCGESFETLLRAGQLAATRGANKPVGPG